MVRNVARSIRNDMRRERKQTLNIDALSQRKDARESIITRKGGNAESKKLKERYIKEDMEYSQACKLMDQYRDAGVKWSACVQAIKTDWVPSFHNVWGSKLKDIRGSEQKKTKDYSAED